LASAAVVCSKRAAWGGKRGRSARGALQPQLPVPLPLLFPDGRPTSSSTS
jgi:hypothetical protein